jgi:membrane-bound lytic murein transglycosylase A
MWNFQPRFTLPVAAVAILGGLTACTSPPPPAELPHVEQRTVPGDFPPFADAVPPSPGPDAEPLLRPRSRWVPVSWSDLPGWDADSVGDVLPALQRGCVRPASVWAAVCAQALAAPVPAAAAAGAAANGTAGAAASTTAGIAANTAASNTANAAAPAASGTPTASTPLATATPPADDAAARAWLMSRLQPYRIEALDGAPEGMITGYYEPLIDASRLPRGRFKVPLHMPPPDLRTRKPYWTRQQLDSLPAARRSLQGQEIAYVADPLDALVLQIQGSGRLRITEPDGSTRTVRLAFAGHNEHPYRSVGRWLIEQGAMTLDQASWPVIKAWADRNPRRVSEMLWVNPRVVFFREEALPDPEMGPRGAQGVPLVPGRSVAIDPQSVPYGTPLWIDTTEPLSNTPLRRLVMAQDTGSAIVGAVRADYFWGWGSVAEQQAGRMKQPLRMWALWPREAGADAGAAAVRAAPTPPTPPAGASLQPTAGAAGQRAAQ